MLVTALLAFIKTFLLFLLSRWNTIDKIETHALKKILLAVSLVFQATNRKT